jgi:glycosyltransferase involved in cell wall biosynthesis
MNILITAPSLNAEINVSGISTIVSSIINHNLKHSYFHFEIGKKGENSFFLTNYINLLLRILYFPFFLYKHKIDFIHQNIPFDTKGIIREFILNLIGRIFRFKTLIHIHGGKLLFEKSKNFVIIFMIKNLLNNNKYILVLSDSEKNILNINYGFSNSFVLPNSISIQNNFSNKSFNNIPTFLFLGRIHEDKGIYEIIEMFKNLKNYFDFRFLLYGDGTIVKSVINNLELILGENFFYGGVVTGPDKMAIISQADFFLLPSKFEGLPMALLESMSMGLIPIVTNVGSMDLLIKDGFNGIKVKKNDSHEFLHKTINILNDKTLQIKISKNAFNTVLKYHNIDNYIISLNKIYNL